MEVPLASKGGLRTVRIAPNETPTKSDLDVLASGSTTDPTPYEITYMRSPQEQEAFDYRVSLNHRATPMLRADRAINTIEKQLKRLDLQVRQLRPQLAGVAWDVTVKDGKLKVVGELGDEDRAWIEQQLNDDGVLSTAVGTYLQAAVDYLETSDDNPAYGAISGHTGRVQSYEFHDVAKQLDSSIRFKELNATSWEMYRNPNTRELGDPGNYRGGSTLEILASRLRSGPAN